MQTLVPTQRYNSLALALFSSALLVLPSAAGADSTTEFQTAQTALSAPGTQLQATDQTSLLFGSRLLPNVSLITEKPSQADAFVDAIGVDSAFNYTNTAYVKIFNTIAAQLISSGIRHLRDGGNPTPTYLQHLAYLGSHGVKHSLGFLVNVQASQVKSYLNTFAPYVDYIEPSNEYDASGDPKWVAHIRAEQSLLWTTVKSNPAYAAVKVIGPSLANVSKAAQLGPIDSIEDAGNFHYATCDFLPSTPGLAKYTAELRASTKYKPIWSTESGYGDDPARPCSTTDTIIAKYVPRTVAVRWNLGEPRIYFNQLVDRTTDPIFGATGLLRANGSAKPQMVTLSSMIALLSDKGSAFNTVPLRYSLSGSTANIAHTLLQKRNGTYFLLVWQEVDSWNHFTRRPITNPARKLTLNLSAVPGTAVQYSYGTNGLLTGKALTRSKAIPISVTDQITFIQLK